MFISTIRFFSFQISPVLFQLLLALLLSACGGSGSSSTNNNPTPVPTPDPNLPPVFDLVVNPISNAYFFDSDSALGKVAGSLMIEKYQPDNLTGS